MRARFFHTLTSLLLLLSVATTAPSFAQANPEISNCEEIKDEATLTQKSFCEAHLGCRLVFGIQKSCTEAKGFLTRLQNIAKRDSSATETTDNKPSLFDRLKSFVGIKPSATSNQVFEANLTETQLSLQEKDPDWRDRNKQMRELVSKSDSKSTLDWTNSSGQKGVYVGDVKDGKANGSGAIFWQNGEIKRGEFKDDQAAGKVDVLFSNGRRIVASQYSGEYYGDALDALPDNRIYKGLMNNSKWHGAGTLYRADGSIIFKGIYDNNQASVGDVYDGQGNITQSVNKPRDAQLAREAAEQEFRNQINAMTAPQLFAKADEFASSDKDKANQYRQALLSRFPDHPLSVRLNEQIAAERAALAEQQRQQAEAQRRQELLAQQQAEQARLRAEADKRERDAKVTQNLQNAAAFMEALSGAIQQNRQGSKSSSSSSTDNDKVWR